MVSDDQICACGHPKREHVRPVNLNCVHCPCTVAAECFPPEGALASIQREWANLPCAHRVGRECPNADGNYCAWCALRIVLAHVRVLQGRAETAERERDDARAALESVKDTAAIQPGYIWLSVFERAVAALQASPQERG